MKVLFKSQYFYAKLNIQTLNKSQSSVEFTWQIILYSIYIEYCGYISYIIHPFTHIPDTRRYIPAEIPAPIKVATKFTPLFESRPLF